MATRSGIAKSALRSLRRWGPANLIVTAAGSWLTRRIGYVPDVFVRHLHRTGTVRVVLPNGRTLFLWSLADDWISNLVYWRGWDGYETETSRMFFARARTARVTLDVGAYVGFYALLAAHANPYGRVFAFEPSMDAFGRLKTNIAKNALANVQCLRTALSDREGSATLFRVDTWLPTSSSLSREFMSVHDTLCSEEVAVTTIDSFVRTNGLPIVDLLKLDTETTEPDVLAGAIETLQRFRPDIVCEVLPGHGVGPRIDGLLRPLGYRYYNLTSSGPREDQALTGHPEWLNYFFTVRELPRG